MQDITIKIISMSSGTIEIKKSPQAQEYFAQAYTETTEISW